MLFRFNKLAIIGTAAFFLHQGGVEGLVCVPQSVALGNCWDAANVPDATEDACELCLTNAVLSNFATPDCTTLTDGLCASVDACNTGPCGGLCGAEIDAYVACEVDDEREEVTPALAACPEPLSCTGANPVPVPAPVTLPPISTPIMDDDDMFSLCLEESADLGNCFDAAMFPDADEDACEACLDSAVMNNYQGTDCAVVTAAVVEAAAMCDCGGLCQDDIEDYVECELNKERRLEGLEPCLGDLVITPMPPGEPSDSSAPPSSAPGPESSIPAPDVTPAPGPDATPAPAPGSSAPEDSPTPSPDESPAPETNKSLTVLALGSIVSILLAL